jgi:hypothetical protein
MPTIKELDAARDRLEDAIELFEEYRAQLQKSREKEIGNETPRAKLIEVINFQIEKVNDLLNTLETDVLGELIWLYDVAHVLGIASSDEGLV